MQGHNTVAAENSLQRVGVIAALRIGYSVPDVWVAGVNIDILLIGLANQGGNTDWGAFAEGFVVVCGCFKNCGGRNVGGKSEAFRQKIVVGIEPFHR